MYQYVNIYIYIYINTLLIAYEIQPEPSWSKCDILCLSAHSVTIINPCWNLTWALVAVKRFWFVVCCAKPWTTCHYVFLSLSLFIYIWTYISICITYIHVYECPCGYKYTWMYKWPCWHMARAIAEPHILARHWRGVTYRPTYMCTCLQMCIYIYIYILYIHIRIDTWYYISIYIHIYIYIYSQCSHWCIAWYRAQLHNMPPSWIR